ncbi:hypothetical protein JR316_0001600 [Psilocybe cubensis]|uniref:Uncharacterized protein n=2 Tax=Psilocybe cubensis TaxID=181762 RepID=A0ACB8HC16_PSICU|nr:hypothetical protein JR316_0001600 [Psilocybe cubensis]KAH9484700.1 hypothetical protein JR316_0001600 [Psilocybe cubensis]
MKNSTFNSESRYSSRQRSPSASPSYHSTASRGEPLFNHSNITTDRETTPSSDEFSKLVSGVNLRLLNVGSVARDHLASERTYLAYVRTSLALSSVGVALVQFLQLGHTTKAFAEPLGTILICVGLIVLLIGTRRFFLVQRSLVNGYYPVSSLEMAFISFALGSLVTATFAIILSGRE